MDQNCLKCRSKKSTLLKRKEVGMGGEGEEREKRVS